MYTCIDIQKDRQRLQRSNSESQVGGNAQQSHGQTAAQRTQPQGIAIDRKYVLDASVIHAAHVCAYIYTRVDMYVCVYMHVLYVMLTHTYAYICMRCRDGEGDDVLAYGTSYTNKKTKEYDLLHDIVKQTKQYVCTYIIM